MSRPFALIVCLPFIWWLWKRDQRERPQFSRALWIPTFWLLTLGSHPLSWWLGVGSSSGDLEGNSFDRTIYLVEIFVSIYVVSKRGIRWGSLIQHNRALWAYYLFLFFTIFWAYYPFVLFKRWFKDLGAIFVLLVILTEGHPVEAIKAVFTRCAFVLYPLSVIFIKYFPGIGRDYSVSGFPMATGVTSQKNSLGEIVLVFCLVLISELGQSNRPQGARIFRGHHFPTLIMLVMGLWLLFTSNSKTSLICLAAGALIVLAHKLPMFRDRPRRVVTLLFVIPPLFFIADTFHVTDVLLGLVGRDRTLTERTSIWKSIDDDPPNPIIGSGYMMYWDLHRTINIGGNVVSFNTVHNGYIETYLDGGALGLCFLGVMLLAVGRRAIREFLTGSEYGRLRLAFFVVMIIYNVSESMYGRRSPLWFAFLLMAVELPEPFARLLRNPVASDDASSFLPQLEVSGELLSNLQILPSANQLTVS